MVYDLSPPNQTKKDSISFLSNVCVDEVFRQFGIGSLLVKSAEEICKKHNCSYINLTSNKTRTDAHALYKKEGYHIIDTCILRKDL